MAPPYRPRDPRDARDRVVRARELAVRQFRDLDESEDGLDDGLEDGLDDSPEDGVPPSRPVPEWRRRLADRTPPALRAARVRVGARAAVGAVLVALAAAGALVLLTGHDRLGDAAAQGEPLPARSEAAAPAEPAAPEPSGHPTGTPSPGPVVVHVAGRVASGGVVTLAAGSRVADALAAAGGPAAEADLDALNLARALVDGEQVLVPGPGDPAPAALPQAAAAPAAAPAAAEPVDLNTATAADLDALPGVGEVLAGRIVAWRTENGPFSAVEDLGEVQGIGPKVLEGLRDLVAV
ncbi:ComEA family DNA-binding protein [Kineococcus sp. SYSU DK002]|uniref:ComEA family DNA-binding protein n=1 Tax=Kineococcus sp. SYSU DK002 TaxID=3383123 RepID=UPI003D7DBBF9